MGANLPIKYDALPLASKRRIDRVCLEFESAWKSRRRPSIEQALGQSAAGSREQ